MAKKLFRARKDRVFGGICGGLGHYLRIDPIFIRLLTIFICVFTAILPVLLVYLICCILQFSWSQKDCSPSHLKGFIGHVGIESLEEFVGDWGNCSKWTPPF